MPVTGSTSTKTGVAPVYLMADIDRGEETINVAPAQAMQAINAVGRSALTIDERIALITQYPGFLRKNRCFSLLASRSRACHLDQRAQAETGLVLGRQPCSTARYYAKRII